MSKRRKRTLLQRFFGKRVSRGFTLVEVIIATVLLGVLVVGVCSFTGPVLSMINRGEENARASLLAEAMNTYIAGMLKSATNIAVVENASNISMTGNPESGGSTATAFADDDAIALQNMMGTEPDLEEVRCLGLHWIQDSGSSIMRLELMNYPVKKTGSGENYGYGNGFYINYPYKGGNIDFERMRVFDPAMYTGLYPVVTLEPISVEDDDGWHSYYKLTTTVYTDFECYNASNPTRADNSHKGFTGVTYIQCRNLQSSELPPNYEQYSSKFTNPAFTYDGASYNAPTTLIFYTVPCRKQTPPTP